MLPSPLSSDKLERNVPGGPLAVMQLILTALVGGVSPNTAVPVEAVDSRKRRKDRINPMLVVFIFTEFDDDIRIGR